MRATGVGIAPGMHSARLGRALLDINMGATRACPPCTGLPSRIITIRNNHPPPHPQSKVGWREPEKIENTRGGGIFPNRQTPFPGVDFG